MVCSPTLNHSWLAPRTPDSRTASLPGASTPLRVLLMHTCSSQHILTMHTLAKNTPHTIHCLPGKRSLTNIETAQLSRRPAAAARPPPFQKKNPVRLVPETELRYISDCFKRCAHSRRLPEKDVTLPRLPAGRSPRGRQVALILLCRSVPWGSHNCPRPLHLLPGGPTRPQAPALVAAHCGTQKGAPTASPSPSAPQPQKHYSCCSTPEGTDGRASSQGSCARPSRPQY